MNQQLISFQKENNRLKYTLSEKGEKCHFLKFLINASEINDNVEHLLSKLCAIGYMTIGYKDCKNPHAIIITNQESQDDCHGRNGKSLFVEFLNRMIPCVILSGMNSDLMEGPFVWKDITDQTRLVIIEDELPDSCFEKLFPYITDTWEVKKQGQENKSYSFEISPKLCIVSNHIQPGKGVSFADRQWFLYFSNHYNHQHQPVDEFGNLFFLDWGREQWLLSWGLIADCIQLYLEHGILKVSQ